MVDEALQPVATQVLDELKLLSGQVLDDTALTDDSVVKETRDVQGRWVKGYCPNPGGKPLRSVSSYLKMYGEQGDFEAIAKNILRLARKSKPNIMLQASDMVMDRTEGKPVQRNLVAVGITEETGQRLAEMFHFLYDEKPE